MRYYTLLIPSVIVCGLFVIGFPNLLLKRRRVKAKSLHQNNFILNNLLEGIPIPTFVVDKNHVVTHWNRACESLTGKTSVQMVGTKDHPKAFHDAQPYSIADLLLDNALSKSIQKHGNGIYKKSSTMAGAYETEIFCRHLGINGKWLYGSAVLLKDEAGNINGAIETWQDLTESKQLERQLIQSQKMEALGTLAGGIAHDFNNILSMIIGYVDLAMFNLPEDSPLKNTIKPILSAANRGKGLVKQVLTYSRKAETKTKPLLVRPLVEETLELFTISLPANIIINKVIQSNAMIIADPSHIHQIVMNLCTNALHAMKNTGGILSVTLEDIQIDENQVSHELCLIPGEFVKLTVADTGHGIPTGIQDKILTPFFSTKKRGEGTGMGLSMTHGIVQQYNGIIIFDSEPGNGTSFYVYLPQYIDHQT